MNKKIYTLINKKHMQPIQMSSMNPLQMQPIHQTTPMPNPQEAKLSTLINNIDFNNEENAKIIKQSLLETEILDDIPHEIPIPVQKSRQQSSIIPNNSLRRVNDNKKVILPPEYNKNKFNYQYPGNYNVIFNKNNLQKFALLFIICIFFLLPTINKIIYNFLQKFTNNNILPPLVISLVICIIYFALIYLLQWT